MKYTLTDRLMWHFMQGTCYKVLREDCPEWDYHQLRKAAKNRSREILMSTPSIGSYRENSLKKNLYIHLHAHDAQDSTNGKAVHKEIPGNDDCCLYYMTKPGSEAEHRWQNEHPDGTFISK